ncbi:MAG: hypothetical protein WCR19_03190 [Acholeplasmataceae bacterium]
MATKSKHKKLSFNLFGKDIFARFFGFEQGIDITDDVAVLFRKNVVIKNIIFITNMMYSIILFVLSITNTNPDTKVSNWVITVIVFPLTYAINKMLKKLIFLDQHDRTKQIVAMHVASLYIFFSAILIYARLYKIDYFETAAYILMYYAVVVISLYQEKKVLSGSFQGLLALLTFIHLVWTYNFQEIVAGESFFNFLRYKLIKLPEFSDILLRTLLFILFYFVVYAIVSMGQYMQEERRKELMKRRQVQRDFSQIVGDLFSVVFSSSYALMDKKHAYLVQQMSERMGSYYRLTNEELIQMNQYAMIHLQFNEIKNMLEDINHYDEKTFDILKAKTELGSQIARRLQLAQKCEDIARAYIEETINEHFIKDMLDIQPEIESQIILLSDLYATMRGPKSYKRPLPHSQVVKAFQNELGTFFDYNLKERFLKFNEEFSEMYNNF